MDTENLIYALMKVLHANQKEQKAREKYNSYDWGYVSQMEGYLAQLAEDSSEAGEKFITVLNKVIDARIQAALKVAFEAGKEAGWVEATDRDFPDFS